MVAEFVKYHKRGDAFRNGVPGNDWWQGFLRRNPELVRRKPQQLQMIRAKASTSEIVNHWFTDCLKPVLDQLELADKPERIFNVDETSFALSGKPDYVLVKRATKSPQAIIGGSGRDNIMVQVCASASGKLLPPYIIYSGKHVMANSTRGGPVGTRYAVSENGWMTKVAYIDWFGSTFIPSLPSDHPPVLLIVDGHSSHVSYEVRQLAVRN